MVEGNEGPGNSRLGGSFGLVHSLCGGYRNNWALNLIIADGNRHVVRHILALGPGLHVAVVHLKSLTY